MDEARRRTRPTRASCPPRTRLRAISSGFCASAGQRGLDKGRSLRPAGGGHYDPMTIGASIFLIALGAILRYAVDVTVSGIEIQTIGLILMIAGVVGLRHRALPAHAGGPPARGRVRRPRWSTTARSSASRASAGPSRDPRPAGDQLRRAGAALLRRPDVDAVGALAGRVLGERERVAARREGRVSVGGGAVLPSGRCRRAPAPPAAYSPRGGRARCC